MNEYRLVVCEKPSVARSIAAVLGAGKRGDGFLSGGGYLVSWCFGHLAELSDADVYDEKYGKWRREDLPIDAEDIRSFDGIFGVEATEWETVKDRLTPPDSAPTSPSLFTRRVRRKRSCGA